MGRGYPGGDSGYILCTGDVPPSRVCFSQFLSGKGAVFSPINSLARVRFSRFRSGKGVVFRPNSLARGVFWWWFDTEILARVVILPFFPGKGGKFCLGRVRVCHLGLHTPIHNGVKTPPPPRAREARTGKRRTKISRLRTEYLNGTSERTVKVLSNQLP